MRKEWTTVKFTMKQYLDTDIFLIVSLESIIEKVESHIGRTLMLASSPYTKDISK
jgi:hypothetical protein